MIDRYITEVRSIFAEANLPQFPNYYKNLENPKLLSKKEVERVINKNVKHKTNLHD